MLYSKRRKNLGGRNKRSNRRSYGYKMGRVMRGGSQANSASGSPGEKQNGKGGWGIGSFIGNIVSKVLPASTKRVEVDLGEGNTMYFNDKLGRYVERGKEDVTPPGTMKPYWGEIFCTSPCNADNKYVKSAKDFTVDDLKNAKYLWEASEGDWAGFVWRITISVGNRDKTYSIMPEFNPYVLDRAGYNNEKNILTIEYMVRKIKDRLECRGSYLIINAENEAEVTKLLTEELQRPTPTAGRP